jgi:hypothetical protein
MTHIIEIQTTHKYVMIKFTAIGDTSSLRQSDCFPKRELERDFLKFHTCVRKIQVFSFSWELYRFNKYIFDLTFKSRLCIPEAGDGSRLHRKSLRV